MIGIEWIELGNTASFLGFNFERQFGVMDINIGAGVQNSDIKLRFRTAIHDSPLVPKLVCKPRHFNSQFRDPPIADVICKRGLYCSSKEDYASCASRLQGEGIHIT